MNPKSKPKKASTPDALLSPAKRRAFIIILLIVPLLVLLGAEVLLRYFEYGGNLDLVVKTTTLGKEYYTLNRDVARRYFSQSGIGIPEAYDDLFEIEKKPTTKRIFMLGESTMAGFPFDYNATAPRLLQDRLQQLLPQYNIEVINAGLAATNSYTALDFAGELVDYKPDAFIVYVGHNEFYGAMGVGSTEYLGQWRWMINLYLKLRELRLFLLMRDAMSAIRGVFSEDVTPKQSTLMEVMVREKTIRYNSPEYLTARNNFEANLRDLISLCKEHQIPLIISTLTSNLRDQKPLLSLFDEQTTDQMKQQWQSLMTEGKNRQQQGDFALASDSYKKAIAIDTMQADAHFALARTLELAGNFTSAKQEYEKARDYDGLRFRASGEFNRLIRTICSEENIPLAEAEKTFEEKSSQGIVGNNLMLEHLHPNFDGYFLLAKTFFQALSNNAGFVQNNEWQWSKQLSDEEYKEKSGVTRFDIEAANFRIFELIHRWPFVNNDDGTATYPVNDKVSELAVDYAKKRIAWSKARNALAEWHSKREEYNDALKEYYALSKVMWYYYSPFMYMGDMYRNLNEPQKAEKSYQKALALDNSPFVHVRLGMLYYDQEAIANSIRHFEAIFSNERSILEMNARDRSTARYFLAAAYLKNNNREQALANLQSALQLDPNNAEAKQMLAMIQR